MLIRFLPLGFCSVLALAASAPVVPSLAYSTYLRDSFTPNAIATDAAGNIYVAGSVIADPAAGQTTALVMKLNPTATQYVYVRFLGGSVYESANAIAVDRAGNAYIAGQTSSPDFPVTAGGSLGTVPTGASDRRSFVTKLDTAGNLVFSNLLGGAAASTAQAIAVTAGGQVVVSGAVQSAGFPVTAGAYTVPDTAGRPYLLKLDATGTKLVYSATGIGGSAIALDAAENIYLAGTTTLPDYPTTPGAYQAEFPVPFRTGFRAQYVTKLDAKGSLLIYSTALTGNGTSTNAGLAIDGAGNVYVTGIAGPGYPYTVTPPSIPAPPQSESIGALPFVSKLDAAGKNLLFSVPAGGAGVQVDDAGAVYAGGRIGSFPGAIGRYAITANLRALAGVPAPCLPNGRSIRNAAYVSQIDAASGEVLGTQFIGGSNVTPAAVALSGSTLWIAGATDGPDVPFTPGALAGALGPPRYGFNLGAGAYLGAVKVSAGAASAGTPQIGCMLDAADLSPAGPVARYQILSIFGAGLGPDDGVTAADNSTTNLAGVSVNFGDSPAILLYVSSSQINLAVPAVSFLQRSPAMQVTVNGLSSLPRQTPLIYPNPHLFMNAAATNLASANPNGRFVPLTLNEDGSVNSASNPAPQASIISVFVNGLAPSPETITAPVQLYGTGGWNVRGVIKATPFVTRVDAQVPSVADFNSLPPDSECTLSLCGVGLRLFDNSGNAVSPHSGGIVYVSR